MGDHRVPDHLDDLDAAVRQAVRHLRPQAVLHARDHDLHRRLGAVRAGAVDVHARRLPRLPGHRRRRHDAAGAGDHRRHHPAARAGEVPGLLHGRVRHVVGARPGRSAASSPARRSILGIPGWRWIFYINVPIGILALFVVMRVLQLDHTRRDHRIDWAGAAMLVVGLVPLLIIAEQGRTWGWVSVGAFICYVIGAAGLVAFVRVERAMGDDALLPLRLFRNRDVRGRFGAGARSSAWACSAASPRSRCTCRSSRARPRPRPDCCCCRWSAAMMVASLVSGQITSRTGRYKIFPVVGSVLHGRRAVADDQHRRRHRRCGRPTSTWPCSASGWA